MLTDTQKQQFETLGFLCLRQLIGPDEMQAYTEAFDEVMLKVRDGKPWDKAPGRQQVVPFYRHRPSVFHRMLDDERILGTVEDLLGEDFVFSVSEGIHHYGGSSWHHDDISPEGQTHLKVVLFLDSVRVDTGCLCVLPGSQFPQYRQRMEKYGEDILLAQGNVPGTYAIESDPGDAVIFDVKLYHAAFGNNQRRGIYLNFFQNPTTAEQQDHVINLYRKDSDHGWTYYTPDLFEDAPPRRQRMLKFLQDHCYQAS